MRTALRKMGNSTGMIIPKAILTELRTEAGTSFDIEIKDRAIVATPIVETPVAADPRDGWAAALEAAAAAGEIDELDEDDMAWINAGTEFDKQWEW